MSKNNLEINFHYGQQDFNEIMSRLIRNKLKMSDEKELMNHNKKLRD